MAERAWKRTNRLLAMSLSLAALALILRGHAMAQVSITESAGYATTQYPSGRNVVQNSAGIWVFYNNSSSGSPYWAFSDDNGESWNQGPIFNDTAINAAVMGNPVSVFYLAATSMVYVVAADTTNALGAATPVGGARIYLSSASLDPATLPAGGLPEFGYPVDIEMKRSLGGAVGGSCSNGTARVMIGHGYPAMMSMAVMVNSAGQPYGGMSGFIVLHAARVGSTANRGYIIAKFNPQSPNPLAIQGGDQAIIAQFGLWPVISQVDLGAIGSSARFGVLSKDGTTPRWNIGFWDFNSLTVCPAQATKNGVIPVSATLDLDSSRNFYSTGTCGIEKMACTIMKSIIHKYFRKCARYSSRAIRCAMRGNVSECKHFNGSSTTTRRTPRSTSNQMIFREMI